MVVNKLVVSRLIVLFVALFLTVNITGCCKRKKIADKKKDKTNLLESVIDTRNGKNTKLSTSGSAKFNDIDIDLSGQLPLRPQDELTSELYEKLSYVNKMYKKRNYEGALRSLDRIQHEIKDDPYLKMQTWGMAAMIYDKAGKTSRRKRAYSKMIEVMAEVQKDPRYQKSLEDGKICQELIEITKQRGDKKYGKE